MPRIAHLADIHWRGLSRHAEYRKSFTSCFEKLRLAAPDRIFIGGDIVHSKTQGISPELIECLTWWFRGLSEIAEVDVILGNHDGILFNQDRQDAISPILDAINHPRIHLYKQSGTYPLSPGFNWCVFSCFDEGNWGLVQPIAGETNIALFHGPVRGSSTDIDWAIEGEVDASFFDRFDFAMLGDIHRMQFLTEDKRIAYCGSSIQQDYGEAPGKGFLVWDIRGPRDFDVRFEEIPHENPFVTIPWRGSVGTTVTEALAHPKGARFRIRATEPIPQIEFNQLTSELQIQRRAAEVVLKEDHQINTTHIEAGSELLQKTDLRDPVVLRRILRDHLKDLSLTDADWEHLDNLLDRYLKMSVQDDAVRRSTKWSIGKLKFDNTFVYGKGNTIDFGKLRGITGIFGRNRRGKSSIIGTLVYTIFNTSDRGAVKNFHIVNTRKGHCYTTLDLKINNEAFRIERQTVKQVSKHDREAAITHLNFFRLAASGEVLQDKSEEQRKDTEKVLRGLLGTADDFMLTSLAAQGEMNTFIDNGPSSRKNTLSRFIGIDMFAKMHDLSKNDQSGFKMQLKGMPDRDWDFLITGLQQERRTLKKTLEKLEDQVSSKHSSLQAKQVKLASFENSDVVTKADLERQRALLRQIDKSRQEIGKKRLDNESELEKNRKSLAELEEQLSKLSEDSLLEKDAQCQKLSESIASLRSMLEKEQHTLLLQEKSISLLKDIPCGDKFPTCKFIKSSHEARETVQERKEKVAALQDQLQTSRDILTGLGSESIKVDLKRIDVGRREVNDIQTKIVRLQAARTTLDAERQIQDKRHQDASHTLSEMTSNLAHEEVSEELQQIKEQIGTLRDELTQLDAERLSAANRLGRIDGDLENLRKEKRRYQDIKSKWRLHEIFSRAVSKRGVPLQIIMSQLPIINAEIAKILQGVVTFTIELVADSEKNDMDVFINYGDSRRIIEVCSGMEKMIASLAIRVALINVSSLPKSDLLIIDEGFGTLDETNVEACNRLLVSLKRWFKSIVIITHVDGVKDVVDNVIDITWNGKDAQVSYE